MRVLITVAGRGLVSSWPASFTQTKCDFKAEVGDRIFVMSLPAVVSKVKTLFVS
jgi:hypothetical protein